MHQSIEERMFVSQQRLWCVKLDHSPSIHDKNTITIHNGIEPKTREIASIIWKELTQRLFLSNEYQPPEVREFVWLIVFPLIETICPKINYYPKMQKGLLPVVLRQRHLKNVSLPELPNITHSLTS